MLGNAETFAVAAGYGPNELLQIGFDTSPQVMSAFVNGYAHLTSDQQPFLQGYLPILSLCQMKVLEPSFDIMKVLEDILEGMVVDQMLNVHIHSQMLTLLED